MSASIAATKCPYCPVNFQGQKARWQVGQHILKSHPKKLRAEWERWLQTGDDRDEPTEDI